MSDFSKSAAQRDLSRQRQNRGVANSGRQVSGMRQAGTLARLAAEHTTEVVWILAGSDLVSWSWCGYQILQLIRS